MLLQIALDRRGVALHDRESLRQLLQVFQALGALRVAAQRFSDGLGKFDWQRGFEAQKGNAGFAMLHADFHSVGGMRIDHHAELVVDLLDGAQSIGVRAAAGDKFAVRARQVEFPRAVEPAVEVPNARAVAADEVEHVALEVRRLRDVHRRTRCSDNGFRGSITSRPEKLIEHVVLVAGEYQAPDGQAHAARDVAGMDVAEVAGGHRKRDLLVIVFRSRKVALEIVNDLRGHPGPVDRIHRADAGPRLEGAVGVDLLDEVLAFVEDALHREVVDVRILQRVHLRALERAHAPVRGQHYTRDAALAAQRVLRRRAGVAGRRTKNIQSQIVLLKNRFKEIAKQLYGDVLEGERRPVRQAEKMKARLERLQRRDVIGFKNFSRGSGFDDAFQVGHVV